jgi:hypothetical protein
MLIERPLLGFLARSRRPTAAFKGAIGAQGGNATIAEMKGAYTLGGPSGQTECCLQTPLRLPPACSKPFAIIVVLPEGSCCIPRPDLVRERGLIHWVIPPGRRLISPCEKEASPGCGHLVTKEDMGSQRRTAPVTSVPTSDPEPCADGGLIHRHAPSFTAMAWRLPGCTDQPAA